MTKLACLETIKRRRMGLPPVQYIKKYPKKNNRPSILNIANLEEYDDIFSQEKITCNINIKSIFIFVSVIFLEMWLIKYFSK
jgi:hypothetical protein